MKHIPYGRHWIDEDDIGEVKKALRSGWLTTGPLIKEFEEKFALKTGARYAIATANGTAALHLACLAAGITAGDEVITSPMTFAATAHSALYVGAKPVFADIDPATGNIDPPEIMKKITSETKAVIPVHYAGLPCDMEKINRLAREHELVIIEDACHALGSLYKKRKTGDCSFSDMSVFSFHPVKHITTGEGGMITTNSLSLYEKLIMLRSHGINRDRNGFENPDDGGWYYEVQMLGFNYRITDIQCALGISQLQKMDYFLKKRREIAQSYNEELKELPLLLPFEPEDCIHSYHLYPVKLKKDAPADRKHLYNKLREAGIYCQVHYIPVHLFPYYRKTLCYAEGDFPHAEEHYQKVLSLPLFPAMSAEEVGYVTGKIKAALQ